MNKIYEQELRKYILEKDQNNIKHLINEIGKYKSLSNFILENNAIFNLFGKPNHENILQIYKHMSIDEQKIIMDKISLRDQVAQYFTNTSEKEAMKNSLQLLKFLSYQMYKSNINQIEVLQEFFGKELLTEKSNKLILCDTETGRLTTINHKNKVFSPYHAVIYNFSMETAYFLESQNITLPSVEEAKQIHKDVEMQVFDFEKGFVENAIQMYPTHILHKQMHDTLPAATGLPIRRKI